MRYFNILVILSRSPYLQHLMEVTPPQQPLWVRVDDEAVTEEVSKSDSTLIQQNSGRSPDTSSLLSQAIAIVLGHLYGKSLRRITVHPRDLTFRSL